MYTYIYIYTYTYVYIYIYIYIYIICIPYPGAFRKSNPYILDPCVDGPDTFMTSDGPHMEHRDPRVPDKAMRCHGI